MTLMRHSFAATCQKMVMMGIRSAWGSQAARPKRLEPHRGASPVLQAATSHPDQRCKQENWKLSLRGNNQSIINGRSTHPHPSFLPLSSL
jgi:hypothetical protein